MRGIPGNPVTCVGCNRPKACPADRLCHRCRVCRRPPPNKRFNWSADLDDRLRRAYKNAGSRADLTRNLDALQRISGFTRVVILNRAAEMNLTFGHRRSWTQEEVATLRECAGNMSPRAIASRLKRSHASVKAKLKALEISGRIVDGYSQQDLQQLLGVGPKSTRRWLALGWLQSRNERIPEACVISFLRLHPDQYQLSCVEEAWFKGLLFPSFNRLATERKPYQAAKLSNLREWPQDSPDLPDELLPQRRLCQ